MDVKVSLIMPNMNNGPILDMFFEKILKNTTYKKFEIIVVDDGSSDNSVEILKKWRDSGKFKEFKLIESEHGGVIKALNTALEHVTGEIIVRLDGDATIETYGWLEKMLKFYLSNKKIGMIVGKIVFDSGLIHSFGRNIICPEGLHDRGNHINELVGKRTLDSHVQRYKEENTDIDFRKIAEVDGALGCCTMFSKKIADEIGGFDMNYSPVWIEDDDFSLNVRKLGKKVFYFPEVEIIHRISIRNPRNAMSKKAILLNNIKKQILSIRNKILSIFPQQLKTIIKNNINTKKETPWREKILQQHYKYWKKKWGFDLINPNMDDITSKYKNTEICWAYNEDMKRKGEEIISVYYNSK